MKLTVDCVVFGLDDEALRVLLVERGVAPHKGEWALPGGFVRDDESIDDAARRELAEALNVLTQRLVSPRIDGPVPWKPMVTLSGPKSLPIAFETAR